MRILQIIGILNKFKVSLYIKIKMSRVEVLKEIQDVCRELFEKKNKDYGDAFAQFGTIGVLVRISDKISRAVNITQNGITLVDDEKLRDTLMDLHNYSAMAIMLIDEKA